MEITSFDDDRRSFDEQSLPVYEFDGRPQRCGKVFW